MDKNKKINREIIPNKNIRRVPKEENKNDNLRENEYNNYNNNKRKSKAYDLLYKFKEIKKKQKNTKKDVYKLNVRQGTSWNQEFVNCIIPRKKYGFIRGFAYYIRLLKNMCFILLGKNNKF